MAAAFSFTTILLLLLCLLQQIIHGHGCDFYQGNWVYDSSYTLYTTSKDCPFIEKEFDCQRNGRPDNDYLKYTWQPTGCNLPRFNGEDFLQRFRGKSIMFVGDSLGLNQWQSLTCMLHKAVPNATYKLTRTGGLSTFIFPRYNTKVMFSRNAFLVDIVQTSAGRVLKLGSIESGKLWKQNDVLIFNSWHWWLHTGIKQPWDFIEIGDEMIKDMDRLLAYEKALNTWANWVENNIDPAKTEVFFQGVSPDHANGADWGQPKAKSCTKETEPVIGSSYPGGKHKAEIVLEKVINKMSKLEAVNLLNITTLSQLRKDGHPSFYGIGGHSIPDCSHWCLPGVPDTWNHLLYATIIQI
ncbi:hypothetical protein AB3S75_031372 [Citrus x aurantiifolia]